MGTASIVLASCACLLAVPTLLRVDRASRLWLLAFNFLGSAWSPYLALAGACAVLGGFLWSSPAAIVIGSVPSGSPGWHRKWAAVRVAAVISVYFLALVAGAARDASSPSMETIT